MTTQLPIERLDELEQRFRVLDNDILTHFGTHAAQKKREDEKTTHIVYKHDRETHEQDRIRDIETRDTVIAAMERELDALKKELIDYKEKVYTRDQTIEGFQLVTTKLQEDRDRYERVYERTQQDLDTSFESVLELEKDRDTYKRLSEYTQQELDNSREIILELEKDRDTYKRLYEQTFQKSLKDCQEFDRIRDMMSTMF